MHKGFCTWWIRRSIRMYNKNSAIFFLNATEKKKSNIEVILPRCNSLFRFSRPSIPPPVRTSWWASILTSPWCRISASVSRARPVVADPGAGPAGDATAERAHRPALAPSSSTDCSLTRCHWLQASSYGSTLTSMISMEIGRLLSIVFLFRLFWVLSRSVFVFIL
jgi:hypothetical protein